MNDLLDCVPVDTRESLEEPSLDGVELGVCAICTEQLDDCVCCPQCRKHGELCESCAEDSPRDGESIDDFFSRIYGIPLQGPL